MKTLAILLLMFVLAACSEPPMRGVIIKKNYRPAWTQHYAIRVGKVAVPQQIRHPPQWDIVVQADGTSDDEGQYLIRVSEQYWDAVDVGDIWERPGTVQQAGVEKP